MRPAHHSNRELDYIDLAGCSNVPERRIEQCSVTNKLLRGLKASEFSQIAPKLHIVPLRSRQTLVEPNIPVRGVYFIEHGIAAVISRSRNHRPIEVSMVGPMGLVGLPAVLGTYRSPFRCVVQIAGTALRMGAEDLRDAMREVPGFSQLLMNYVQARMVQQAQITVCNTRHRVSERVARWLLMGMDRLESNTLLVTHDLLARMLGIRRAGVTVVISEFEAAGILRRSRGKLTICDRAKLEQSACDCYSVIRSEFDRLIVHPTRDCEALRFAGSAESLPNSSHLHRPAGALPRQVSTLLSGC